MSDTESSPTASTPDGPPPPGRRVRLEPTPPGFGRLVLGAVVAVLAPLFGILMGSASGGHDTASGMGALYWGFFIGGLVGVVGLVAAGWGGLMLMRHAARTRTEDAS